LDEIGTTMSVMPVMRMRGLKMLGAPISKGFPLVIAASSKPGMTRRTSR
jgi:hypothetical protein